MSSGKARSCERKAAYSSSGRKATGAESLPATRESANDEHRRNNQRPVVAMPSVATPSRSGLRRPTRTSRSRWSSMTTTATLGSRQVGVVELRDEAEMIVGRECPVEQSPTRSGRKQHHGFAEVDHRDATAVIETPPMADGGRNGHLPTAGYEEL